MMISAISNMWQNAAHLACEALFDCGCRVIVRKKYKAADGSTQFNEEVLYENIPCRISYESLDPSKRSSRLDRMNFSRKNDTLSSEISATVKLFVSADNDIPPGSRIVVFKEGKELCFVSSGIAAIYPGHKEIMMVSQEEYA